MHIVNIRPKIGQKIVTQESLPKEELCQQAGESPAISSRWREAADLLERQVGGLAQNAAEAQRLAYAGRSTLSLIEVKTFDESRLESMPLFANAKRQGGLL